MNFVAHWTKIAKALGLEIQTPATVRLSDGRTITAPILLKNFGGQNGMLLLEGVPNDIRDVGDALVAQGYGWSCLGPYDGHAVDLSSAKEALADWTWSGPQDQRPTWLVDPPSDDDP